MARLLKYCNRHPDRLLGREHVITFFGDNDVGRYRVTSLAEHIRKCGAVVVSPRGGLSQFENTTMMYIDLMRCFLEWLSSHPDHGHQDVLEVVLCDPFFITALSCHLGDQPKSGDCQIAMIVMAQAVSAHVNYSSYDCLVQADFFPNLVNLLRCRKVHLIFEVLRTIMYFVGTTNSPTPQLGLSITLSLCRESLGLIVGLKDLLQQYAADKFLSFVYCSHMPASIVSVDNIMSLLYQVCLCVCLFVFEEVRGELNLDHVSIDAVCRK